MTDADFMAWQHRVIANFAGCRCNLEWKHADPQPPCETCAVKAEYLNRLRERYDHDNQNAG